MGGESADFVVELAWLNEDASVLNVLAEAKNRETFVSTIRFRLINQPPDVGLRRCDQLLKTMLVFPGSRYDLPDRKKKTQIKNFFPSSVLIQGRSIEGQDDVCSVSFFKNGRKKQKKQITTQMPVLYSRAHPIEENPVAICRSQAIPVLFWSGA